MREVVTDRLFVEFGDPAAEVPTAFCWHLAPGLDVIAEKDSLPNQGVLWVPWPGPDLMPRFGEFYAGLSDRHEGTFNPACPSLARGRAAMRMSVRHQAELEEAVALIRLLAAREGAAP